MTLTKKENTGNEEFGVDSKYSSKKEKALEGKVLMEARLERMKNLSPELIVRAKLMQLKLKMDDFLANSVYTKDNFFADFLTNYIDIIYDRRNRFAKDIDISPVKLSQVLNNHREPSEDFILRLTVHSELIYKDICDFHRKTWLQIFFHEKLSNKMIDQDTWRPKIEKHVSSSLRIY